MSLTVQPFLLPERTLRKVRSAPRRCKKAVRRCSDRPPAIARQVGLALHAGEPSHEYVLKNR